MKQAHSSIRIGILQTGDTPESLREEYGSYARMCQSLFDGHENFTFKVYDVVNGNFPGSVDECSGWLVTGSAFSVYQRLAWIDILASFIQQIDKAKKPLIGICFGHQMIAQALQGEVRKSDKGWGIGLDTYQLNTNTHDSFVAPLSDITLNIFHQDQVVQLPPKAKLYAQSDFCENAGFCIDKHIVTLQAHPEFGANYNRKLLSLRRESMGVPDKTDQALQDLKNPAWRLGAKRYSRWFGDFFARR